MVSCTIITNQCYLDILSQTNSIWTCHAQIISLRQPDIRPIRKYVCGCFRTHGATQYSDHPHMLDVWIQNVQLSSHVYWWVCLFIEPLHLAGSTLFCFPWYSVALIFDLWFLLAVWFLSKVPEDWSLWYPFYRQLVSFYMSSV